MSPPPLLSDPAHRALAHQLAGAPPSASDPAAAHQELCGSVLAAAVALLASERGLAVPAGAPEDPSLAAQLAPLLGGPEPLGGLYERLLQTALRRGPEGSWLLVVSPIARKGSGSFYSPQGLTGPTTRRTLAPLMRGQDRVLSPPDALLSLSVCDPSMGAGSFLLEAWRQLCAVVLESCAHHGPPPGAPADLARWVRQQVATRCLYGVDRDPLAVLCARASLWLAVGDPALPLTALSSTLRWGDALLGATPDDLRVYPLAALSRARPGRDTGLSALRARARRESPAPAPGDAALACDLWCALWFWPLSGLSVLPTPATWGGPTRAARKLVSSLAAEHAFFHWPLAFPDVFSGESKGFDAVLGNPPWEIHKPSSKEFFSAHDPDYGSYGKREAVRAQQELFAARPALDAAWQAHRDALRDHGHFCKHRFVHQGAADRNAYKLFLERSLSLLRPGGQLGLVVPAALASDKGAAPLRRLLLEQCRWRWLYGFDNREQLFEIEGRFAFCVVIAETQGKTDIVQVAFGQTRWTDWEVGRGAVFVPQTLIRRLSPERLAVLPLADRRDLELMKHLVEEGLPVEGPAGWGLRYAREFDMTTDAGCFVEPKEAADGNGMVPLVQGVMLGPRRFNRVGYLSGRGLSARWTDLGLMEPPRPQFYVAASDAQAALKSTGVRVGFRPIARPTDTRTLVAALVPPWPCGNSVGLVLPADPATAPVVAAVLSSLVFDWQLRRRQGGSNVNWFLLAESSLPPQRCGSILSRLMLALHPQPWFDGLRQEHPILNPPGTTAERHAVEALLDALVARIWGLDRDDLLWMLQDCDHSVVALRRKGLRQRLDPRGFWRVDKVAPPAERRTVLTVVAFDALVAAEASVGSLEAAGEALCADGGWRPPRDLDVPALGMLQTAS